MRREQRKRIYKLCKKVWPAMNPWDIAVLEPTEQGVRVQLVGGCQFFVGQLKHPRALDALEAAICVLAEVPIPVNDNGHFKEEIHGQGDAA